MADRLRPALYLGLPGDVRDAARVLDGVAGLYDGVDLAPYYCEGRALELIKAVGLPAGMRTTTRVPVRPGATWQLDTSADTFPDSWIVRSVQDQIEQSGLDTFDTVLLQTWRSSWDAAVERHRG